MSSSDCALALNSDDATKRQSIRHLADIHFCHEKMFSWSVEHTTKIGYERKRMKFAAQSKLDIRVLLKLDV